MTDLSAIMAAAASLRTLGEGWDSLRPSSKMPSAARAGTGSSLEQEQRVERSSTCTSSSSSFSSWSFTISLGTRLRRARAPAGRGGNCENSENRENGGSLIKCGRATRGQQTEVVQHAVDVSPAGGGGVVQQFGEWREEGGGEQGLSAGGHTPIQP